MEDAAFPPFRGKGEEKKKAQAGFCANFFKLSSSAPRVKRRAAGERKGEEKKEQQGLLFFSSPLSASPSPKQGEMVWGRQEAAGASAAPPFLPFTKKG
jgi:hypothetical protein